MAPGEFRSTGEEREETERRVGRRLWKIGREGSWTWELGLRELVLSWAAGVKAHLYFPINGPFLFFQSAPEAPSYTDQRFVLFAYLSRPTVRRYN